MMNAQLFLRPECVRHRETVYDSHEGYDVLTHSLTLAHTTDISCTVR
jgi:hypothetical protein